ncbi:Holliday junction ATP-dependent DNA helicase RuvB [Anaerohalosphaera lusitana]|uniref:Holliday junction ATP-dependent DNA helicase RuvB n=1 Tax=Anaerohalosphaera lusitana TaxID=1936003 RepID=A0A1U9NK02_9BACT|nr:Holliday junction DNA helicase RuvB C-terminal domain-containing protein [Anaerohalosphaera lusitana]AQT68251.1 Holliday junction ATP-dependent DNA helicase RuvB [Anaerohalosphaera lusitana]
MSHEIGTDVNQTQITSLSHIKGQPHIVELLRTSLDAYFANRANNSSSSFGPVLMVGPSGTGKTLTAKAIHCELGNLQLIESNGEMLNPTELTSMLLMADENSSIFVDEAQALDARTQHVLLTALSERKVILPKRKNNKKTCSVPLANFTIILATTHEFQLQNALRNRMRLCCRFNYYSADDLTYIVKQRADALKWDYENSEVLHEIAKRAKQTPRIALNRNLQMAWSVCSADGRNVITKEDVCKAFDLLDIDEEGLDTLDQAYLCELSKRNSMKLNVLSSKLGLPSRTISSVIEPYLLRQELIEKQGSERQITEKGKQHISQNLQ